MKAIRVNQTGGPEVLTLADIELPAATSDFLRVKVELAGVNFVDVYHRRGQYQMTLPSGIGIEGIGSSPSGERFFWLSVLGSYAQELNIPKNSLTSLPTSRLTNEQLLPLLCQGMTAHYLVDSAYRVNSGETALVTAAAGGVGLLLVQLLTMRGVRVIACASTEARAQLAKDNGAHFVGTYEKLNHLVSEVTNGVGVNVVYDSVGKDYFDQCLDSLTPAGMYVLYGGASGPVPPFDLMRLNGKSLAIRRPTLATYTATPEERVRRLSELIVLAEKGALQYPAAKVFPLSKADAAHQLIESRTYSGKIGLDPWNL